MGTSLFHSDTIIIHIYSCGHTANKMRNSLKKTKEKEKTKMVDVFFLIFSSLIFFLVSIKCTLHNTHSHHREKKKKNSKKKKIRVLSSVCVIPFLLSFTNFCFQCARFCARSPYTQMRYNELMTILLNIFHLKDRGRRERRKYHQT